MRTPHQWTAGPGVGRAYLQRVEQCSIKNGQLVVICTLNLHSLQLLPPLLSCAARSAFESRAVRDLLFEVPPRLLDGDKRHAHAYIDRLRVLLKSNVTRELYAPGRALSRTLCAVGDGAPVRERRVKPGAKVPVERRRRIRAQNSILALRICSADLSCGRIHGDRAHRVREIREIGRANNGRTRGFKQKVWSLGAGEGKAQVSDTRGLGMADSI